MATALRPARVRTRRGYAVGSPGAASGNGLAVYWHGAFDEFYLVFRSANAAQGLAAQDALRTMGISIPSRIADKAALDQALRNSPRLSPDQIQQFLRLVGH